MCTFFEAIGYVFVGAYMAGMYSYFLTVEPFCFYLPGGLGKFYKVHQNILTKFDDIVGCEDIKDELRAHLQFFHEKKLTKGWMFNGPSGTGKTMMARAVAGESSLPFIEIFTNGLRDSHIPTVLNTIIKKYSPCIIFIDECSNILNLYSETFLRKIDGIEGIENVFLILATDQQIGKNFVRSGRIDKVINFQPPTYDDRQRVFLKMGFDQNKSAHLSQQTSGLTYADLSIIPREIEFHQLIKNKQGEPIDRVINSIKFGRYTSQLNMNLEAKKRVAYHEIGHLLTACLLKNVDKPHKVTILPEGQIVGNTQFNKQDETYSTRSDILRSITVILASSIFEKHYLGEHSTLCHHDFKQIEDLLNTMENNHMLELHDIPAPTSRKRQSVWSCSPVSKIIKILTATVIYIINQHTTIIDQLLSKLIICETMTEKEITEIIGESLFNTVDLDWQQLNSI